MRGKKDSFFSGIGDPSHLLRHDVSPLVHANDHVGRHLQSHVGTGELVYTLPKKGLAFSPLKDILNPSKILDYLNHGRGPLSSASYFEATGFLKAPK